MTSVPSLYAFVPLRATLACAIALLGAATEAQISKVSGAMTGGGNVTTVLSTSNGATAVFRSNREDSARYDLWRGDRDARQPLKLSGTVVAGGNVRPDFKLTGDQSRTVFRADRVAVGDIELWSAPMSGAAVAPTDVSDLPAGRTVYDDWAVTSGSGTQRVVFVSNRDTASVRDLFVANADGSGSPIKLSNIVTNPSRDVQAFAISPTNTRVAFNGDLGVDGRDALYVTDITGGAPLQLFAPAAGENVLNSIQFSTDGSLVVFRVDRGAAGIELLRVPVTGGAAVSLSGAVAGGRRVRSFRVDSSAAVSSQKVVFVGDLTTTGKDELYSVDIDAASPNPVNLSAPLATPDSVAGFKLSEEFDKVAFDTVDGSGRRRLWATTVLSVGVASMPNDVSGSIVAGGDVTAYEIERQAKFIAFVASKTNANVRELWSAPADGSATALKLSGALVAGGNVGNDIAIVATGTTDTIVYRADATLDEVFELWRVLSTGGPAVRLSGSLPPFADVTAYTPGGGNVYFLANREVAAQQELFVNAIRQTLALDVDGDGQPLALTDALMIARYLLGNRGSAVVNDAYGAGNSVRQTSAVDDYLRRLLFTPAP